MSGMLRRSASGLAILALFAALALAPPATAADLLPSVSFPVQVVCFCKGTAMATMRTLEASGLAWDGAKTLYVVGDNGVIASAPIPPVSWTCLYDWQCEDPKNLFGHERNDFESVAFLRGRPDRLYVGVEGTVASAHDGKEKKNLDLPPTIQEFDLKKNKFTGVSWQLGGICYEHGNGMEAMTFVPDLSAKNGFGGYFLASSQCHTAAEKAAGMVYGYDLEKKGGTTASSFQFFLPNSVKKDGLRKEKNSDFDFVPELCTLFVTYDDESGKDEDDKAYVWTQGTQLLAEYKKWRPCGSVSTLTVDAKTQTGSIAIGTVLPTTLAFHQGTDSALPKSRGVEAAAAVVSGAPGKIATTMYLGIDMSPKQLRAEQARKPAKGEPADKYQKTEASRLDSVAFTGFYTAEPCDPCYKIATCAAIEDTSCGWCADLNTAWTGTKDGGPKEGECGNWIWNHGNCGCAAVSCCGQTTPGCGWCKSLQQAMPGGKDGPLHAPAGRCRPDKDPAKNDWIYYRRDCAAGGAPACP